MNDAKASDFGAREKSIFRDAIASTLSTVGCTENVLQVNASDVSFVSRRKLESGIVNMIDVAFTIQSGVETNDYDSAEDLFDGLTSELTFAVETGSLQIALVSWGMTNVSVDNASFAAPTVYDTIVVTWLPTGSPTHRPTFHPSLHPTHQPTADPSEAPVPAPTRSTAPTLELVPISVASIGLSIMVWCCACTFICSCLYAMIRGFAALVTYITRGRIRADAPGHHNHRDTFFYESIRPIPFSQSVCSIESLDPTCCICLVDMNHSDKVKELACRHCFHPECLDEWLQRSRACPLCKREARASARAPTMGLFDTRGNRVSPREVELSTNPRPGTNSTGGIEEQFPDYIGPPVVFENPTIVVQPRPPRAAAEEGTI